MSSSNQRIVFVLFFAVTAGLSGCKRADTIEDSGSVIVIVRDGGPVLDAGETKDAGVYDAGPAVEVTVTRTSPNRGSVLGGTSVTISGTGFLSGAIQDPILAATLTHVTFGGNPALRISVLSDSTLQTLSPPGVAGPADVEVTNPNNPSIPARCTGCFDYLATVQITGVSPARGPTTGGTSFTVTGIGFLPGSVLLLGSHAAIQAVVSADGTSITAISPAAPQAGPVDVRVFNDSGVASLHSSFNYFALPMIIAVSPAGGTSLGGTPVTLKGGGFLNETVAVSFGGQPATSVQVVDDLTVTLVTPAGASGPVDVQVQDGDGTVTLTAGYVYYPAGASGLALYGVVPNHGSTLGGTAATVVGVGLSGSNLALTFGAAAAAATGLNVIDDHLVQLVTPAGSVGSVAVGVSTGAGNASLPNGFTYADEPAVLTVSPASGPSGGGTSVRITGTGFSASDRVLIGPLSATSISVPVSSTTEIDAVTPPGTAGPALVQVISSGGAVSNLVAGFTYLDAFSLIQVTPASGAQAGGTNATLLGTGLGAGLSASFGSTVAPNLLLVDPYTATCTTPPGNPGQVDVVASEPGPGGTLTSTIKGGFSYFDPTNLVGGVSGGPLNGTLNVTVLNGDNDPSVSGRPIQGALVILGVDSNTPFQGPTDARGQITFSDPTIIKAQTVTVSDSSCANGVPCATTVDGVTSQNLTVFLDIPSGSGNLPTPCPCGDPIDCVKNCDTNFCGPMGTCMECNTDADCANPALIHPDPTALFCLQGSCVHCLGDGDCASNANLKACDTRRGLLSTFTCVQCNGETEVSDAGFTVDKFCSSAFYCNTNTLRCQPPDEITVTVYGFKKPPGAIEDALHKWVARVGVVQPAVYFLEPFQPTPQPPNPPLEFEFDNDGVSQLFVLGGPGNPIGAITLSLYAKFGVLDSTKSPPKFTPWLLGVTRGIQVDPLHPTVADIILETHLDQTATLNLTSSLLAPDPTNILTGAQSPNPNPVQYDNFAYMDLGQDGVILLDDVTAQSGPVTVPNLPAVAGNGVLFLTQGFQNLPPPFAPFNDPFDRNPTSVFFRRVQSDFGAGVDVGPFLSFLNVTHPDPNFPLLDGNFNWTATDPLGPTPDLSQLLLCWGIFDTNQNQLVFRQPAWQIVVPGSQTSVSIPAASLTALRAGLPQVSAPFVTILFWSLHTAKAPRFDFNYWSYQDLNPPVCLTSQPALSWTQFQSTFQQVF